MRQDAPISSLKTEYASKVELAQIFHVSIRTINRAMVEGLTDAAGAVVGRRWRFDVTKAWEWFRQRGT